MIYAKGDLLVEVVLLEVVLRRENGQVLTVTIDADGIPNSVKDMSACLIYEHGIDELTEEEKQALKRLVGID